MFQIVFGEIVRGRIRPLVYLGYTVLLSIALFAAIAVVGLAFSGAQDLAGAPKSGTSQAPAPESGLAQTPASSTAEAPALGDSRADRMPAPIRPERSPIATALAIPLVAAYAFGILNLTAKRIRDIGLPGWPGVALLTLLAVALWAIFGGPGAAGVQFVSSLALILVPSDLLGRDRPMPPAS